MYSVLLCSDPFCSDLVQRCYVLIYSDMFCFRICSDVLCFVIFRFVCSDSILDMHDPVMVILTLVAYCLAFVALGPHGKSVPLWQFRVPGGTIGPMDRSDKLSSVLLCFVMICPILSW